VLRLTRSGPFGHRSHFDDASSWCPQPADRVERQPRSCLAAATGLISIKPSLLRHYMLGCAAPGDGRCRLSRHHSITEDNARVTVFCGI
jgi:hypothetical protein